MKRRRLEQSSGPVTRSAATISAPAVPEKSITEIEREQLRKLKKNLKNLMLDE